MIDLFNLRREFTLTTLEETQMLINPIEQFEVWFNEAIASEVLEPNAMTLSTVGIDLKPSSRVLLLKQVKKEGFIFFTNYESRKAKQIMENPNVCISFMWHELERQIRIEGIATKVSDEESDSYFETRPTASKLGAWASPQSQTIPNREYLNELNFDCLNQFDGKEITRPLNWGGYIVKPSLIEFWQGRENRLHDRIQYKIHKDAWVLNRLAP